MGPLRILSELEGEDRELFELMLAEPACTLQEIANRFDVDMSSVWQYAWRHYREVMEDRRLIRGYSTRGTIPDLNRDQLMRTMLMNPHTSLGDVGRAFGISRQRVDQIVRKRFPDLHEERRAARAAIRGSNRRGGRG